MTNPKQCTMKAGEVLGAVGISKLEKSLWGFFKYSTLYQSGLEATNSRFFVTALSRQHKAHSRPNR